MKNHLLTALLMLVLAADLPARELDKAIFTQVVNQVRVVSAKTKDIAPAKLNGEFYTPDLIQTGPRSLAELTAPDKTITRVGSNTIFSYAQHGRTVNLERGSVLFHSPKGKGGGVIRTKAASASVLGTTLIVSATADGGFKCVVLEGKAELQMPNGNYRIARPGQVVFVMTGGQNFGPTVDVNLEKLVDGSKLVQEFEKPLPSLPKVNQAVERQKQDIEAGRLIQQDETPQNIAPAAGAPEPDATPTVTSSTVTQTIEALANRLTVALGTDITISGTPFDSQHVFSDPVASTVNGLTKTSFKGVLGHNITMRPESSGATHVQLNFTDYLSGSTFSILADAVLKIDSPHLNLYASPAVTSAAGPDFDLYLIGRTGVNGSDSSINAENVGNLTIASGATMNLANVSVINQSRAVTLNASAGLTMTGGSVQAGSDYDATLRSAGGDLIVSNSSISGENVTLTSGDDLTVTGGSITGRQIAGIGNRLSMYAADEMTLKQLNLSGFASTVLDANTIILENINFTGEVKLYPNLGLLAPNPNSGAAPQPGYANFIRNVDYNGQPAQFFVGSTITIATRP